MKLLHIINQHFQLHAVTASCHYKQRVHTITRPYLNSLILNTNQCNKDLINFISAKAHKTIAQYEKAWLTQR